MIPNATFIAIAKNARDLLNDAALLFEHGRFPRATALAVLAEEEAGKFAMVKWDQEWRQKLCSHPEKLAAGAAFYSAEAAGVVLNSTDGDTGGMHHAFTTAPENDDYLKWVQQTQAFHKIKMDSFYVDLHGSGEMKSEPCEAIGQKKAAEQLAYAHRAVERLYVSKIVKESLPPLAAEPGYLSAFTPLGTTTPST